MPTKPRRSRDLEHARALRDQFNADLDAGCLDLGQAVKRMREISGLTQEQFAHHRGLSPLTLKRIETGKGNPTVETLNRIGGTFGLRVGFVRSRAQDTTDLTGRPLLARGFRTGDGRVGQKE